MKKLALLLPLVLLMSCEKVRFDSTLDVQTPFSIQGKRKSLNIPAGKFDATFSIKSKKNFELKIGEGKDQKIKFAIPENVFIPHSNGHFFLSSQESDQGFDMEGDVETRVENSTPITESEQCSIKTGTRRVCHYEPGPVVCVEREGRQVCHQIPREVCSWEDVYEYGRREVTYHYQTSQTSLDLDFKVPGSDQVLGHLDGRSHVETDRINDFIGPCRLYHHFPY